MTAPAYDRVLIARMLDVCGHPRFTLDAYREQAELLRAADNADAAGARTVARTAEGGVSKAMVDAFRVAFHESTGEYSECVRIGLSAALTAAGAAQGGGLDFEPDEKHTVADMANVGYSLMQTIAAHRPAYSWNETPAEIVVDLLNELHDAKPAAQGGGEADYGHGYRDGYTDAADAASTGATIPVAWRGVSEGEVEFETNKAHCEANPGYWQPLYTHPTPAAQPSDAVRAALEAMVAEKVDYMRLNNLGDPETQHTIRQARIALASSTPAAVGGDRLLWRVVANAGRLSHESKPRWAHVSAATGHGSTVSADLCREAGFDPDEQVGGIAPAAVGGDAVDAARYRWLRDKAQTTNFNLPRWTVARESGGMGQTYRGDRLDTEIDAAIAAEQGDAR